LVSLDVGDAFQIAAVAGALQVFAATRDYGHIPGARPGTVLPRDHQPHLDMRLMDWARDAGLG
jgi:hypothetical protein